MTTGKPVSVTEIGKHNSPSDCWLVVDGQVWDFTNFHGEHPGGSASECSVHGDMNWAICREANRECVILPIV